MEIVISVLIPIGFSEMKQRRGKRKKKRKKNEFGLR
jgi:hypothetical protein